MADFSSLKTAIQNAIRTNGNNEITGQLLQDILLSMVVVLGDEAITNVADDLSTETSQRQNADGTLQGNINAEATARAVADTALQNAINTINSNISNGYVYAGIATPSATPVTGKVFYIATTAGTYTNFGGLTVTKGINILKYNGSTWSQEQIIGIDDYPTAGSSKLALSGGIDAEIKSLVGYYTCGTAAATAAKTITASAYILLQGGSIKVKFTYKNTAADATLKIGSADAKPLFYGGRRAGSSNSWEAGEVVEIFYDGTNYMANNVMGGGAGDGAFDISVYNAVDGTPTPYADLAAALGTNGANIPDTLRKGGMSVKFIQGTAQSSDNKYIQARCMAQNFTTDVTQWQSVDDVPTALGMTSTNIINKYIAEIYIYDSSVTLTQVDFAIASYVSIGQYAGKYLNLIRLRTSAGNKTIYSEYCDSEAIALSNFRQVTSKKVIGLNNNYMVCLSNSAIKTTSLASGTPTFATYSDLLNLPNIKNYFQDNDIVNKTGQELTLNSIINGYIKELVYSNQDQSTAYVKVYVYIGYEASSVYYNNISVDEFDSTDTRILRTVLAAIGGKSYLQINIRLTTVLPLVIKYYIP